MIHEQQSSSKIYKWITIEKKSNIFVSSNSKYQNKNCEKQTHTFDTQIKSIASMYFNDDWMYFKAWQSNESIEIPKEWGAKVK